MSEACEVIVGTLPEEFKCPVCLEIFQEPVLIPECAHSLCKTCYEQLLKAQSQQCPLCNHKFPVGSPPSPNLLIKSMIEKLQVYCRHGLDWDNEKSAFVPKISPHHCPEIILRSHRIQHELECEYAPISCKNWASGCRVRLPRKYIDQHLLECPFHKLSSQLNKFRKVIEKQNQEIEQTRKEIALLQAGNRKLHSTLARLVEFLQSTLPHVEWDELLDIQDPNPSESEPQPQHVVAEIQEKQTILYSSLTNRLSRAPEQPLSIIHTLKHDDCVEALAYTDQAEFFWTGSWDHYVRVSMNLSNIIWHYNLPYFLMNILIVLGMGLLYVRM
jgi:hypothetical protein